MIERHHPTLSIGAQCRLLSISRSSFYYEPRGETEMNLALMQLAPRCHPLRPMRTHLLLRHLHRSNRHLLALIDKS